MRYARVDFGLYLDAVRRQLLREAYVLFEEEIQVADTQKGRREAVQILGTARSCRVWHIRCVVMSVTIPPTSEKENQKPCLSLPRPRSFFRPSRPSMQCCCRWRTKTTTGTQDSDCPCLSGRPTWDISGLVPQWASGPHPSPSAPLRQQSRHLRSDPGRRCGLGRR